VSGLAEEGLAGRGGLLQPCGDVDRVPRRERVALARDDLARVDADATLDADAPVAVELLAQPVEHATLVCRRSHRTERVVLVDDRHAAEDHRHGLPNLTGWTGRERRTARAAEPEAVGVLLTTALTPRHRADLRVMRKRHLTDAEVMS
jgi:hypothetical protein